MLETGVYLGETFGFGTRPRLTVHAVDGPLAVYDRGGQRKVALVSALLHDIWTGGFSRVRK